MSFDPAIQDKPHFISVVDNNVDLLNTLNDKLHRLEDRLKPYSSTPPNKEDDKGDQGFTSEFQEHLYRLETEIKYAISKVESITDSFQG